MSVTGDTIGYVIFFVGGMASVLVTLAAILIFVRKHK
jgi:LPXTG-motif cell wall-anchored protein